MIDAQGFRPNVGIVLANGAGQVFWARRIGQDAWQFPQGGIQRDESPEAALYRELHEEVGLSPAHVTVLGSTRGWLRYRLPSHLIRRRQRPTCIGQKQVWFLLRLETEEAAVQLDATSEPEFDDWSWVSYWHPLEQVVSFKRGVYERALEQLAPLLFPDGAPTRPTDSGPGQPPVFQQQPQRG
ncbi:dinucleoside polyphosphate hydrolase [Spiribacter salinus M19-40]|uniref:RNA pyrophosphohydrolase n=1 Tax=Spiribacter salinus M19-40 TaxID=1260251 RepID=R4VMG9_9GAMM|nr:RNA pyrophosphohydrolase [Spiribacter salinus]AGM41637.1 dinucleoside polyphosphate hydrolase [Spiribacter salinus M19-40]MBY5268812.1 RNA pyrophosphohydrolase [Spiribacter salinus]MDR9413632.1 RNA pyrophosphohydrolase [Spiribacter sp.]MDR9455302.1 RNA pyrophosphohydrolase [Spiribacter sp.]